MTPKRIWLIVLVLALVSIDSPGWSIPPTVTLGLTLTGVIALFVTPGLMMCGLLRRRRAAGSSDLIWIAVVGPVVLATVGLVAWLMGNIVSPRLLCRAATITLMGAGLLWAVRQPADLRLSGSECRVLVIALLLTLVAAGRSVNSLGVRGELYAGTVTRTLAADDRSDTRAPFIIPIDVANRWQPFSKESQDFYRPFSFTSRGPLVGLAATPVVLTWSRMDMRTIAHMDEPFTPVDRYGYMQYRFSIIVFSAAAVIPFFVALGATELALVGTAIYALSPFFVHEVYFTWTKQATVPLMLSAFCLATGSRYLLSGALAGLAYLAHPSAAYSVVALLAFLVTVAPPAADWRVHAGTLVRPSQWWRRRTAIGAFVLGVACVTLPWGLYSYGKPNPATFLSYLFKADYQPAENISQWVMSRLNSLASTLVPLYAYWRFHLHPSMQPIFEPPLQVVTFFTQVLLHPAGRRRIRVALLAFSRPSTFPEARHGVRHHSDWIACRDFLDPLGCHSHRDAARGAAYPVRISHADVGSIPALPRLQPGFHSPCTRNRAARIHVAADDSEPRRNGQPAAVLDRPVGSAGQHRGGAAPDRVHAHTTGPADEHRILRTCASMSCRIENEPPFRTDDGRGH